MKELMSDQALEQVINAHNSKQRKFKGYTIDEIKSRRVIIELKKQFYKERIMHNYHLITQASPLKVLKGGEKKQSGVRKSIFGKFFGSLDVMDYASLGMSAVKGISSVVDFFKKRRMKKQMKAMAKASK